MIYPATRPTPVITLAKSGLADTWRFNAERQYYSNRFKGRAKQPILIARQTPS
jgi:hypothetical protein